MRPERIWWLSTRAHQRGWTPVAKLLKALNYLAFRAVLPYECDIQRDVTLWHRGLGTVVHPNVRIGSRAHIGHGVTITGTGDRGPMLIGDDVKIAAHAILVVRRGEPLTLGDGCVIGAGAVVTNDVPAGVTVGGNPAVPL